MSSLFGGFNSTFGAHRSLERTNDFFTDLTKAKLLSIGFTENQYIEFKEDTEQLCGKFCSVTDSANVNGQFANPLLSNLYQLARTHLFRRWNSIIQAGVQDTQQHLFWFGWLTSCLNAVNERKKSNRWHQRKHFDGQLQDVITSNNTVLTAPATATTTPTFDRSASTITKPAATTNSPFSAINTTSATTNNSLFAFNPTPPTFTAPTTTFGAPKPTTTTPESITSKPPIQSQKAAPHESMLVKLKSATLSRSASITTTIPAPILWRDVVLRVSFKNLTTEKIRPKSVPLIRCVDAKHQMWDEDSDVIAAWLEFSSLQSLIKKHLNMNCQNTDLSKPIEFTLCACFSADEAFVVINCSSDLHRAYNKWIRQKDRPNNDFWLMAVPHSDTANDSDSDIPDTVNPFGPSKGMKRRKKL